MRLTRRMVEDDRPMSNLIDMTLWEPCNIVRDCQALDENDQQCRNGADYQSYIIFAVNRRFVFYSCEDHACGIIGGLAQPRPAG